MHVTLCNHSNLSFTARQETQMSASAHNALPCAVATSRGCRPAKQGQKESAGQVSEGELLLRVELMVITVILSLFCIVISNLLLPSARLLLIIANFSFD